MNTKRMHIDSKWDLVVNKYILGQSLGPIVDTEHTYLFSRPAYDNSYEIRMDYVEGESGLEEEEEEESEEEEEDISKARVRQTRRRRTVPVKAAAQKRRKKKIAGRKTTKKRKTAQPISIAEAEQNVTDMEADDADMLEYINLATRSTDARRWVHYYNQHKQAEKMSDSQMFTEQLKIIMPEDPDQAPGLFLNVSKASSDLRRNVETTTATALKLLRGTYLVNNIRIVSNNEITYRKAIDFMVITGCMSDFDAYRALCVFRNAMKTKPASKKLNAEYVLVPRAGEVDASILLKTYVAELRQDTYLNVSNANGNFSWGVTHWKKSAISYAPHNLHYIEGIPLCSNNIATYRLALFHLYGRDFVLRHAAHLQRFERAIKAQSLQTEVR